MTITTATNTDDLLTCFFSAQAVNTKGVRQQRVLRVEERLRECLETEGHRVLASSDLLRLEAERVFDPDAAVSRMSTATDLVFLLSIFLDPEWLMTDPLDQRVQLTLTDKLTGFVLAHDLVDRYEFACPLLDIRCGIDRARSTLRQAASRAV